MKGADHGRKEKPLSPELFVTLLSNCGLEHTELRVHQLDGDALHEGVLGHFHHFVLDAAVIVVLKGKARGLGFNAVKEFCGKGRRRARAERSRAAAGVRGRDSFSRGRGRRRSPRGALLKRFEGQVATLVAGRVDIGDVGSQHLVSPLAEPGDLFQQRNCSAVERSNSHPVPQCPDLLKQQVVLYAFKPPWSAGGWSPARRAADNRIPEAYPESVRMPICSSRAVCSRFP